MTIGLSQQMFGLAQLAVRAVVFPLITKRRYTPGAATSLVLWLPIALAWIRDQQRNHGGLSGRHVLLATAMVAAFSAGGIVGPIQPFKGDASPYAFEDRQIRLP